MPFFSICIPTHDRIDTLRQTISTVLAQDFQDYEVIVSDNASRPSAENAVTAFGDVRIRYHYHREPIDANDNWEFALQKAKGSFVLLLADDDALVPSALRRVFQYIGATNADIVHVGHIRYSHPKTRAAKNNANCLLAQHFTGDIYKYDSISFARDVMIGWGIGRGNITYDYHPPTHPSGMFMARHLLGAVSKQIGRITSPPFADVGFLNVVLQANVVHFLDLPLAVVGVDIDREINGPLHGRRRDYALLNKSIIYSPFRATTFSNMAVDAHLRVLRANADILKVNDAELTDRFYLNHYFEIIHERVWDHRTAVDLMEFFRVVWRLPLRTKMRVVLRCILLPFYRPLRNALRHFTSRGIEADNQRRWIRGEEHNFHDIKSCSLFIQNKYLKNSVSSLK